MTTYIISTITCCEDVQTRCANLVALGLIRIAFSLFCCSRPNHNDSATFYIEIFHRDRDFLTEKLFECPASPNPVDRRPQSFFCIEVTASVKKKRIYSIANFYVVTLPKLKGGEGRSIILLDYKHMTPMSMFVGVPIVDKPLDWPNLVEDRWDTVFSLLRQQCKNKIRPHLLGSVHMDTIAAFMSVADFRRFARPITRMIDRFKAYSSVLENIAKTYHNHFKHKWKKEPEKHQENAKALRDVRLAMQLLVQKIIDPCFVLSHREGIDPEVADQAEALCRTHCRFLAVGFSVFPGTVGQDCRNLVGTGHCTTRRHRICRCTAKVSVMRYFTKVLHKPMVQCSNALRIGIRRFTSHTPIEQKGKESSFHIDITSSPDRQRLEDMQQAVDTIESMAEKAGATSSSSSSSSSIAK